MLEYSPSRDFYSILAVPDTASPNEIKAAYRKLMKGAHPDVNADRPEANAWAQTLNEAYEVLSEQRAEYDRLRQEFKRAEAAATSKTEHWAGTPKAAGNAARPHQGPAPSGAGASGGQKPPRTPPPPKSPPPKSPPKSVPPWVAAALPLLAVIAVVGGLIGVGALIVAAINSEA